MPPEGKKRDYVGQTYCEVYPVDVGGRPFGVPKPIVNGPAPRRLYLYTELSSVPNSPKYGFGVAVFIDHKDPSAELIAKCGKGGPMLPMISLCMEPLMTAAVMSDADIQARNQLIEKKKREEAAAAARREQDAEAERQKAAARQARAAEESEIEKIFRVDLAVICIDTTIDGRTKMPLYINVDFTNRLIKAKVRYFSFSPYQTEYYQDGRQVGGSRQFVSIDTDTISWGEKSPKEQKVWKIDRNNGFLVLNNSNPLPCSRAEKL